MSGRPQVTITLGRSRQVVKRTSCISDIQHSNYPTSSGTKRSIRERLGNGVDDPISYDQQYKNKRQHTKDHRQNVNDDHMEDENHYMQSRKVGRNDLRFKLIQKNILKNTSVSREKYDYDLREKISRKTHGPLKFNHPWDLQEETQSSGQLRRIASARSAADMCRIDTLRKPYSLTSANKQLRHRSPSPGKVVGTARRRSPPEYLNDAQCVPLLRSSDMLRPTNLTTTSSLTDALRAKPPSARTTQVYAEPPRPAYRASPSNHEARSNNPMQQTPVKHVDHPSVASLLHSLGLGKYAILFQAEEVDMPALKQMGDSDLKALGIPMGPRKKILLALPRPQQKPAHKGN